MIGMLQGTMQAGGVVLTPGGVGYVARHCGSLTHSPGEEVTLLVTTITSRDGEMTLWSFDTAEERDVFGALTAVPRVGPTAAGAVLRSLGAGGVVAAVLERRPGAISAVKGVGKKTAEAIVGSMKVPDGVVATPTPVVSSPAADQVAAQLVELGFGREAVEDALGRVSGDHSDVATLLPIVMGELAKGGA